MEPSEKSLDSPTFAVTGQRTTVLRRAPAHSPMRCDRLDAVPVGQVTIQTVAVIRLLSPISRAGKASRKLCPRTPSTSWLSCGDALSMLTARGRLDRKSVV